MSITIDNPKKSGRLCNQIIRNLALSLIAEKNNLYVTYSNYHLINDVLGIHLYVGEKKYSTTTKIRTSNYINLFNNTVSINYNLNFMNDFFQSEEITDILCKHLHSDTQKQNIMRKNPFKDRYNNNEDVFIHIRLGDVAKYNPGIDYYVKAIKKLTYKNLYVASDSLKHKLIKELIKIYPNIILVDKTPVETIQFGSTNKYIILSAGTFSAMIGYLGFYSEIYFLNRKMKWWCGAPSRITNKSWNAIL